MKASEKTYERSGEIRYENAGDAIICEHPLSLESTASSLHRLLSNSIIKEISDLPRINLLSKPMNRIHNRFPLCTLGKHTMSMPSNQHHLLNSYQSRNKTLILKLIESNAACCEDQLQVSFCAAQYWSETWTKRKHQSRFDLSLFLMSMPNKQKLRKFYSNMTSLKHFKLFILIYAVFWSLEKFKRLWFC